MKIEENHIFVSNILKYWKIIIFLNKIKYVTWISVYPQCHIPFFVSINVEGFSIKSENVCENTFNSAYLISYIFVDRNIISSIVCIN